VDAQTCTSLHLNCDRWHESLIAFTKSGGYGSFAALLPTLLPSTLIIWGEEDKILGTKAATKFQQRIPQSRLCWIPECGHVPHLEKATETATAILDFIT
jgi:pimeloyl-ACP methyl ester carboxylesterase